MVRPVHTIAFVAIWHLASGFVTGQSIVNPTVEDCSALEVLEGCSDTFTAYALGTFGDAPNVLNQIILFIDAMLVIYFIWVIINIFRPGAGASS